MPSESRPTLTIQTEKANHYSYLKEFRVEQCAQFLQHKCTNHRPFTCFHWHFNNQRRRRPVRKRDGSFNYSPDTYCTKYDETTGICPDGDDCPLLHRTAGDTERRYHLRYYKTCTCVHETDTRGFCVKNGPHCAFAHGPADLRPPVYDVKEIQAMENADSENNVGTNGPTSASVDKEKNIMNEDPKWHDTCVDTTYVLTYYKTEPCKRPPRLCRQGYACPQYHNSRDKRRSPNQFKYRSTPCPNVKHGDEWGETGSCDAGDSCQYCHTRTEQQFHPEIYKSTRCNDMQQSGHCPRGVFCAFAHAEQEMTISREAPGLLDKTNLVDILSNVLPPELNATNNEHNENKGMEENSNNSSPNDKMAQNRNMNSTNNELNKFEKDDKDKQNSGNIFNMSFLSNDTMNFISESHLGTGFYSNNPIGTVLGDRELDTNSPTVNSISQGIASTVLGSSAPMNIPSAGNIGGGRPTFSPPSSSPLPVYLNAFQDPIDTGSVFINHASNKIGSFPTSASGSYFNLISSAHMSSPPGGLTSTSSISKIPSISPTLNISNDFSAFQRLVDDDPDRNNHDKLQQARAACEVWKREADDNYNRAKRAEQSRDDAITQLNTVQKEFEKTRGYPYLHALNPIADLKEAPLHILQSLQNRLKGDLDTINKIINDRSKNNGCPPLNSR